VARRFDSARHPRDRYGRFTSSRTSAVSPAEKASAAEIVKGFKPKRGVVSNPGPYLQGIAPAGHENALAEFADNSTAVNKSLRAGKADAPGVAAMDAVMFALPDDLVLSRRVPRSAFGSVDPADLVGQKVRDAGYSSAQLGTVRANGDVRMRIATPAGTRAAVDPSTGEVVLDRDTELVVARVEPNTAGGQDMFLTVLPKTAAKPGADSTPAKSGVEPDSKTDDVAESAYAGRRRAPDQDEALKPAPAKRAAPAKPQPAADDNPEGGEQVRAELMKLRVPQLQAQMRERGLKPGRLRKSQLVDALVADETGDGAAEPTAVADATPTRPASFQDRVAAAVAEQAALDAAPYSLPRQETHDRLGNRGGLTAESRNALIDYQGADYAVINGALRDTDTPEGRKPFETDDKTDAQIAALDAAMAGSPLKSDVVAWRGMRRAAKMFGDRFGQDMTGMQWRESAYVSTSASRSIADQFSSPKDGVRMRVLVPAGTGAVEVSPYIDERGVLDEAELLINRGVTMRVVTDRGYAPDGIRDLDVEVVP
jgi:hypothetical protein